MANLTTTITESITLNGAVRGSTQSVVISDIDKTAEKIVECPGGSKTGAETIIGNWAKATNSASKYQSYNYSNSKYIRVTNLDSTQYIEVGFVSNGLDDQCVEGEATLDSYRVKLNPGQSHILWDSAAGKKGENTAPRFTSVALTNLSYIVVYNPTGGETAREVLVELFVAGI